MKITWFHHPKISHCLHLTILCPNVFYKFVIILNNQCSTLQFSPVNTVTKAFCMLCYTPTMYSHWLPNNWLTGVS